MSHSGLQSTFAPASHSTTGPLFPGSTAPIAGRAMPAIVRKRISATARNAPLFPAETTASARPSRTRSTATPSDVPDEVRTACEACASIAISRSACTISSGSPPSSGVSRGVSPTRTIFPSPSRCASSAPATISPGASSPPIASTAITGTRSAEALLNGDPVFDARLTAEVVLDLDARKALAQHGGQLLRVALARRVGNDVVERVRAQQPLPDRRARRALLHGDAFHARVLSGEERGRAAHRAHGREQLVEGKRLVEPAE